MAELSVESGTDPESPWMGVGVDSGSIPGWVTEYFFRIAADYFNEGPRHQGEAVAPGRQIEMTPEERKSTLPSLDKLADISRVQGRPGAWPRDEEHARDKFVQAYKRWHDAATRS